MKANENVTIVTDNKNTEETKKSKGLIILIAALITSLIAVGIVVFALNKSYRIIKVIKTVGDVYVERNNDEIDAYVDMLLENKDSVITGEDSTLSLQLDSTKFVEVAENSKIQILATGRENKNSTRTKIVLEEGSVINEIKEKLGEKETFDIETPSVSMGVRGTKFIVNSNINESGRKETYIEVTDGTVEAYREGEEDTIKIEAGYNATITEDDKLSDVVVSENMPYFEFAFNPDDIRVVGKTIKEAHPTEAVNEIQEILGVNIYKQVGYDYNISGELITSEGLYVSADEKYESEWIKNEEWKYVHGPDIWCRYNIHDEVWSSYGRYMGKENDNPQADELISPLIPTDSSLEEFWQYACFDQALVYAKEHCEMYKQDSYFFNCKCNLTDEICIYEISKQKDADYVSVNIFNEDGSRYRIEFENHYKSGIYYWSLFYYEDGEKFDSIYY